MSFCLVEDRLRFFEIRWKLYYMISDASLVLTFIYLFILFIRSILFVLCCGMWLILLYLVHGIILIPW